MIEVRGSYFLLETANTSYVFQKTESGLLRHLYYGAKAPIVDFSILDQKLDGGVGTACLYENHPNEFIDQMDLELSFVGKGDYRQTMIEVEHPRFGTTLNCKYQSHAIISNPEEELPTSRQPDSVLEVITFDETQQIEITLFYKVFEQCDVITKYIKITNKGSDSVIIHQLMSHQLDCWNADFVLMSFNGAWSKERHLFQQPLTMNTIVLDSKTGGSSNKTNPFFILRKANTDENQGEAYGFNLVYSGNHQAVLEVGITKKLRVMQGIHPLGFHYPLHSQITLTSPEAVLSYTNKGLNQLSHHFHDFINHHIIALPFQGKPRPVLINNWEATYFHCDEKTILELAKKAQEVGAELFVLDDGWFGKRNNDQRSLGDWDVNLKKLPHGLIGLSKKIHQMGMQFGLWVEPEMINEDSELYRQHPEFAIQLPNQKPSLGRNQLVLDLTSAVVRDWLVEKLTQLFSSCELEYVKWDYNRNITELFSQHASLQQAFCHRYILGLYDVLKRIRNQFPNLLIESCASGGNRFDLGMLCFTPQIWTSDDTDYYERLFIQTGTSYGYPLSAMGAHVSAVPNHQTLRNTPLASRFHLSCFGLLGYELDLLSETDVTLQAIKKQIAFYKKNRDIFQYGRCYRSNLTIFNRDNMYLYVVNKEQTLAFLGFFQGLIHPSMAEDRLYIPGLEEEGIYQLSHQKSKISITRFGGLINLVLPIKVRLNGRLYRLISKVYKIPGDQENCLASGKALKEMGVRLHQQFMGSGLSNRVRVLGDFGSRLYEIRKKE
ncbi:MAG: alpha-galactosidase [Bacilli bacterium]|jgi:alpha-galactosidase|nr:alpha-galactosidase [Bacilli bacterium]